MLFQMAGCECGGRAGELIATAHTCGWAVSRQTEDEML